MKDLFLHCKKFDDYCKSVKSDDYIQAKDEQCSSTKCEDCKYMKRRWVELD